MPVCVPILKSCAGHGAADIEAAIAAVVAIVHVSTELRVAFRHGLEESLKNHPSDEATYKLTEPAEEAVKKIVLEKSKLFNNL